MNSKVTVAILIAGIACAFLMVLTACVPASNNAAAPTKITPDKGCSIAETGHQPGHAPALGREAVKSLTITCDGHPTDISGDFTNRTVNEYTPETRLDSAIVVNGEARIWHSLKSGDRECLTIQRLDETQPSRDTCTVPPAPATESPAPIQV